MIQCLAMLPNLKVIRHESTRLNRIVPDKAHRVITPSKKHHINSRYSSSPKTSHAKQNLDLNFILFLIWRSSVI